MDPIIEVNGLRKSYTVKDKRKKTSVEAVKGIDLQVAVGEVFGFLGPNGAGKTTTMRILTTLLRPDSGQVRIAGFDLSRQPEQVRQHIGYVGQLGGADIGATGRENLVLASRLYGARAGQAKARAHELLEVFGLETQADHIVRTYSGGQKRRLEIALGMANRPQVLFLDEPTTGLDPQSRNNLWDQIRLLQHDGTTVFLTTHYLDEADRLSDRLGIMDHGEIVATGAPEALKKEIAGDVVTLRIDEAASGKGTDAARALLSGAPFVNEAYIEGGGLLLYVDDGKKALPHLFELLEREGFTVDSAALSQASLDDVFLKKTGRLMHGTMPEQEAEQEVA